MYNYLFYIFIKGKKYFGRKRRPEKKKRSQLNDSNKKNVLMVKLNPQKLK